MRKIAIAFLGACIVSGATSSASATTSSSSRYEPLFTEVWTTVADNFYDPSFHGLDWRAVGKRYRARLAAVKDDQEFQSLVLTMLDELKASHVGFSPPVAAQTTGGVGIGASFEHIGNDLVVSEVVPLSDAQRKGLRPGDRVTPPSGGLRGPLGQSVPIQVTDCDGKTRIVEVRREFSAWPPPQPSVTWREITLKPSLKIGYLRPERFDDGAAELIDKAMHDLNDTQGLVIDLRGGGGGNLSALRLVSYFAAPNQPMAALFARSYLAQLGHAPSKDDIARLTTTHGAYTDAAVFKAIENGNGAAAFYSDDVGALHYGGRVLVVMDAHTASAGEGFVAAMRRMAKVPLIGRPTAGYLLSAKRFAIDGGWTLTIPVDAVWDGDGHDMGDKPITPDIVVSRTVGDICQGRDTDLERAVEFIENER